MRSNKILLRSICGVGVSEDTAQDDRQKEARGKYTVIEEINAGWALRKKEGGAFYLIGQVAAGLEGCDIST